MLMSNYDPRPLRVRVMEYLQKRYPNEVTMADICEAVNGPHYTVSPIVSKMFMYGGPVEKLGKGSRNIRWKYRPLVNG